MIDQYVDDVNKYIDDDRWNWLFDKSIYWHAR
jgi:hypothetical protein